MADGDLSRAVEWDRKFSYAGPPARPVLSNGAACWLEENKIAYRTAQNPAANFLMDIYFESTADAVLFKMFWL